MFNHYRTLLANLAPDAVGLAEEKIPAGFAPVRLPDAVTGFRRVVFGATPDRAMVNYRCRQLMAAVHASPLAEWVTKLDPRVAYALPAPLLEIGPPAVVQTAGTPTGLSVLGTPAAPDDHGVMRLAFEIDVLSTTTVSVYRHVHPLSKTILEYALGAGGVSQLLPLTGAGYSFRLSTDDPGTTWAVAGHLRPTRDPGELVASLESLGDAHLIELFGLEKGEPWETLRRVWRQTRETPLRLAAITTAAVYRTEEARSA